ncbi:MAG: divergent polysaccharide deacetylase family protein [Alphaproteobacteria bacterium]|nr:divergent polysaccharide deacetylase family protein [Alphaproteobacteria bacterium]
MKKETVNVEEPVKASSLFKAVLAVVVLLALVCAWLVFQIDGENKAFDAEKSSVVVVLGEKAQPLVVAEFEDEKPVLSVEFETPDFETAPETEDMPDNADENVAHEEQANEPQAFEAQEQIVEESLQIKATENVWQNPPFVAIVVDDLGINVPRTKDILSIKAPLTTSFLTYGKHLQEFYQESLSAGHEVMIHAPMEPKSSSDAAPDELKVSMSDEEIEKNFLQMISKFNGAGVLFVNNHMGSLFTENREKLNIVMKILKREGLFFLDSKTTSDTVGEEVARENGVEYIKRDVFLDNKNEAEHIKKQLERLENIARKQGYAVAICHPKSQTVRVLSEWLESLENKDVKLVHLRELMSIKRKKQLFDEQNFVALINHEK